MEHFSVKIVDSAGYRVEERGDWVAESAEDAAVSFARPFLEHGKVVAPARVGVLAHSDEDARTQHFDVRPAYEVAPVDEMPTIGRGDDR